MALALTMAAALASVGPAVAYTAGEFCSGSVAGTLAVSTDNGRTIRCSLDNGFYRWVYFDGATTTAPPTTVAPVPTTVPPVTVPPVAGGTRIISISPAPVAPSAPVVVVPAPVYSTPAVPVAAPVSLTG